MTQDEEKLLYIKRRLEHTYEEILNLIKHETFLSLKNQTILRKEHQYNKQELIDEILYNVQYELIDAMHVPNEIYDELSPILTKELEKTYSNFILSQLKKKK